MRTYRCGHLSPLQDHVLGDPPIGIHVNALIFVAHQKLHSVCIGKDDDCVGFDATLDLEKRDTVQGVGLWLFLSTRKCSVRLSWRMHWFIFLVTNTVKEWRFGKPMRPTCQSRPFTGHMLYQLTFSEVPGICFDCGLYLRNYVPRTTSNPGAFGPASNWPHPAHVSQSQGKGASGGFTEPGETMSTCLRA